ncbi:translocon-associated protein subunit beta-like [Styela clava]|uniref:translocon-associated protein subunit beta-like n=1 Tax=Styela clava TaxID=7725 RepID=UPI0019399C66|nr:translocon-associated protein subunit beta-like [Styela clava]
MKLFISLALLCFVTFVHGDDVGPAKLIVVKDVTNDVIAQGMDLTIKYQILNIGESAATDVELADSTFPEIDFELVAGMFNVKWPKIAPSTNVSHAVVVKPLRSGDFNFTSAVVQYVATEGEEPTFGFSSEVGEVTILTEKEYQRIFADHFIDWALFMVWCIPSLFMPYLMYYKSKTKYGVKAKRN